VKKFNNFSERAIISELKKIHRELRDANRKVKDDTWFEDDPRAVKEKDYERVYHKPTFEAFTGGCSELSNMIISGSNYIRYAKHGSAKDGVRYTYKKRKKE